MFISFVVVASRTPLLSSLRFVNVKVILSVVRAWAGNMLRRGKQFLSFRLIFDMPNTLDNINEMRETRGRQDFDDVKFCLQNNNFNFDPCQWEITITTLRSCSYADSFNSSNSLPFPTKPVQYDRPTYTHTDILLTWWLAGCCSCLLVMMFCCCCFFCMNLLLPLHSFFFFCNSLPFHFHTQNPKLYQISLMVYRKTSLLIWRPTKYCCSITIFH